VEIESCASGGGRADYGALRYTHRIWTSDCTDALERLEIQRGASTFFPPAILGAHVSASPNHQTHRRHTLSFRAIVALAYHFGVELNPLALTTKETAELRHWISLHKRLRPVLHEGTTFRQDPIDGRYVWGASEKDKLVAFMAQGPQMMSEQPRPLRLPLPSEGNTQWRITALHPEKPDFIRISDAQTALLSGKRSFTADEPLQLPTLRPESALILELERIEGA
jgi:alpha-galactosidase